jgi:hypothetical protein
MAALFLTIAIGYLIAEIDGTGHSSPSAATSSAGPFPSQASSPAVPEAGASVSSPFASRGEFATRLDRSEAVVAAQARSFGAFGAWTGGTNPASFTVAMAELVPTTLVIRASCGDSPIGLLAPRLSRRGGVSGLLLAVEPAAYRRGTE